MQKAISKYGLAAHLALLAVAPLLLFQFCGDEWIARTLIWLSILVTVWMLVEPSRRKGEMLHDARTRVFRSVYRDPLFWLFVVLAVIAAIRSLNGGVAMAYDAETMEWSLRPPTLSFLPGSVDGTGYLHFATAIATAAISIACRHALGKSARVCFLFIASFLAGVCAIVLSLAAFCGHHATLDAMACSLADPTFVGNAFGLHFAGSMIALVGTFERKWKRAAPLLIVAIGGCGVGLYVFSPDFVIVMYVGLALFSLLISLLYAQRKMGGLVVPKCLAFLLIAAAAGFLIAVGLLPESVKAARFAWLGTKVGGILPDTMLAARDALSAIAFSVWKSHSWIGTGLGSFGLDIRFEASAETWRILANGQNGALNGWWQMLAERGILGLVLFASPMVLMAWTYILRAFYAVKHAIVRRHLSEIASFHPICGLGVGAVAVTVACGFIDHSFWRPETIMAVAGFFAMSASAFPSVARKTDDKSETEK